MADALSNQETVVRISPTIEADYSARGVFPAIRKEVAGRLRDGSWRFNVPLVDAEAMLADACKQRNTRRPAAKVGISVAYSALERALRSICKPAREAVAAPVASRQSWIEVLRDEIERVSRENARLERLNAELSRALLARTPNRPEVKDRRLALVWSAA